MAADEYKIARENWQSYAYDRDNGHLDFVKPGDDVRHGAGRQQAEENDEQGVRSR